MRVERRNGVFVIEPVAVRRNVPGLGEVVLREPTRSVELLLVDVRRRPFRTSPRLVVNQLISLCAETPLTPAQVDALPELSRARLRNGVAEAASADHLVRRLRGSHLTGDERLLAAMIWQQQERVERLRTLVHQLAPPLATQQFQRFQDPLRRLHDLFDSKALARRLAKQLGELYGPDSISTFRAKTSIPAFSSPTPLVEFASHLLPPRPLRVQLRQIVEAREAFHLKPEQREFLDKLRRFYFRWRNSRYWFLLQHTGIFTAARLADASEEEIEGLLLDALERILLEEPVVAAAAQAISAVDTVDEPQRELIVHGLRLAQEGEWVKACSPLLHGIEGAFWAAARSKGLIDDRRHWTEGARKPVSSVDALLSRLSLGKPLLTFLRHKVLGGTGNDFRHGDAQSGYREEVLYLFAALIGWLETFAAQRPIPFERHLLGALRAAAS